MPASKPKADPTLGFLRVADLGDSTFIGGYLILNLLGRPLEFHCTEPIKPNRAQQILYGATLEAYLFGEQIGQSLVGHSQLCPQLLVTDQRSVLSLRSFVDVPVIWYSATSIPVAPSGCQAVPGRADSLFIDQTNHEDLPRIESLYEPLLSGWNLEEPFLRIHEAITELQKAA